MYIPEFICGIVFTLIAEIVIAVIWAMSNGKKK